MGRFGRSLASVLAATLVLVLALMTPFLRQFPPVAKAEVPRVIDQFPGPYSFLSDEVSANNRLAQSFTASDNYLITEVQLHISDVGTVNWATVTLMSDTDGNPGPDFVLTDSFAKGLYNAVEWISFKLNTSWQLSLGATYWIILDSPGQQKNGYEWEKRTSYPMYDYGSAASCSGGGCTNWNIDPGTDYLFKTFGVVGPSMNCVALVDSASAGAGDPLNYTMRFENNGSEYASLVWINTTLSGLLTYVSDDAGLLGAISNYPNWTFSNIDVGTYSFNISVRVSLDVKDLDVLRASFTLQFANRFGVTQEDRSCEAESTARVPSLSFSKTVTPKYSMQNGHLAFTLAFTNSGSRPATKVWVNDTLPDTVIFSYDTAQNGTGPGNTTGVFLDRSINGNTQRFEFGNVMPGDFHFDIFATIKNESIVKNGTAIENSAWLTYTDSSHRICGPIWAYATARVMGASIRVRSFTLDPNVAPLDVVRYQIMFNNDGTTDSALTWINDTLPVGVIYQSDTASKNVYHRDTWVSGRTYHYNFSSLPAGQPQSFTITTSVDPGAGDGQALTNSVCLNYTDWDYSILEPTCSQSSAIVRIPTIALEADSPSEANPGDFVQHDLYIKNDGSGVAKALWVNTTWGFGLSYYYDNCFLIGGVRWNPDSWNFTDVGPGTRSCTFTLRAAAGLPDGLVLRADYRASYTDYKGRSLGSLMTLVQTKITAPVIAPALVQNRTQVPRNDLIIYTIYYNNTGTGIAGNVWINDTIPDLAEFRRSSDQYMGSSGGRFTWHFIQVVPGPHSMTVTVKVYGEATVGASLLNSMTLDYDDANGNHVGASMSSVSAMVIDGGSSDGNNPPSENPPAVSANILWVVVAVLLITLIAMWLFVSRKFYGLGVKNKSRIDELFLLHRSGELIRHHSRSLRPDVDSDVLSAMLVAVQSFVKESFNFRAGDLEELKFGNQKIMLINGEHVIIAAVVSGPFPQRMVPVMSRALGEIEGRFGSKLEEWSGMTEDLPQIDDVLSRVFQNGNGL